MRPILVMCWGLTLLPVVAWAQPSSRGPDDSAVPVLSQDGTARQRSTGGALPEAVVPPPGGLAAGGFAPPGQKPPRPEKAIGPDLAAYIFAPIGGMVGPITEGLHAFDAAIAPINEALQPLTGPYGAALEVAPDGAPSPTDAEPRPTGRGPRK